MVVGSERLRGATLPSFCSRPATAEESGCGRVGTIWLARPYPRGPLLCVYGAAGLVRLPEATDRPGEAIAFAGDEREAPEEEEDDEAEDTGADGVDAAG